MAVQWRPCWDKTNVGKAISRTAKLDEKQTHYFLTCHSPMDHIQDVHSNRAITEELLYQKIMGSEQRDLQAVVYGDPGTGKSHLIHWLKLRCDSDLESEVLVDVVTVLIKRRSGSLKDALEQLIDQLGTKFAKYLDPVRKAIEKISESTARQLLANQLSVELGPGWTDRGREPLPRLLREIGQACRAKGFGSWLCRDGGVINRTIDLLTEASDVRERESRPQFTESDFNIPDKYCRPSENSLEVLDLIDNLADGDRGKELRKQTAEIANEALRDAVVDMMGLSGANLRKIFDVIRKDLQDDGKRLAIYVEDVSAMAELDVEVVNALEPQNRHDLCPLTAILGMTGTGFSHLRANQKDRIEILVCVDSDTNTKWSHNRNGLAQFVARYLNATRLDESEVIGISKHRKENDSDVHISKCTNCEVSKECHARFGKVRINDCDIGLYPLTLNAPLRMLDHIERDDSSDISPNQRGLLSYILSPILSNVDALAEHRFPYEGTLSISVSDPIYWTEFLRNYCGGWDDDARKRLLYLAELWIEETDSASEAAQRLAPLLEPLGFPLFSKEVPKVESGGEGSSDEKSDTKNRESKQTDKAAVNKLDPYLQSLRAWCDGGDLARDRDFRQLVANFIRRSIPWDSERHPPVSEWKRLLPTGKYEHIRIEGQISKPVTTSFFIDQFPRNEETRELLEALARFEYLGSKSWNFSDSEHHKRITEKWVRTHSVSILNSLQPNLDAQVPVTSAIQFLCLVATLRNRERLPQSVLETVSEVFADRWVTTPVTISVRWTQLVNDMESRHEDIRKFVSSELSVVQGRTGGINFINPLPVIETATEFQKQLRVAPIAEGYFDSFWKTRYFDGLSGGLQTYSSLLDILNEERIEVGKLVESVQQILMNAGFDKTDLKASIVAFCQGIEQLVETRKASSFTLPHAEFDDLIKRGVFSELKQRWGFAVEKASRVAASPDHFGILLFDPHLLKTAVEAFTVVDSYLKFLDHELSLQEEAVKEGGDPKELERCLLDSLGKIADLAEQEQETDDAIS
jgi:hypothetical protein